MGKLLDAISEKEKDFIRRAKVFFVATAPLSKEHHVNVSPKAPGSSVIVIDSHTVAYADLTGSGAETAAHVMENQRMTLMFCNIESGPPMILRLHGTARVLIKEEQIPASLINRFPKEITTSYGFRCIYMLKVNRISSSCGYSLPVMKFEKYRKTLDEYTERKGEEGMNEYCLTKNSFSIDGIPSLGLLRYRDKAIRRDPQEGYIYGKVVSAGDVANAEYDVIRATQKVCEGTHAQQNHYFMLALGVMIGSILSGVYFQLFQS